MTPFARPRALLIVYHDATPLSPATVVGIVPGEQQLHPPTSHTLSPPLCVLQSLTPLLIFVAAYHLCTSQPILIIVSMKTFVATLAFGLAVAELSPQQVVLQAPAKLPEQLQKPIDQAQNYIKGLTEEARQLWDEVTETYPEIWDNISRQTKPKPHIRKGDQQWDHIIRGRDVQSVWIENANGEQEREIEGKLESYSMRTKKVDPSELGVDRVKQYSGYLDDDEEDKHLFYCKNAGREIYATFLTMMKGFLNPETTLRMIPWFFGSMEALDVLR